MTEEYMVALFTRLEAIAPGMWEQMVARERFGSWVEATLGLALSVVFVFSLRKAFRWDADCTEVELKAATIVLCFMMLFVFSACTLSNLVDAIYPGASLIRSMVINS